MTERFRVKFGLQVGDNTNPDAMVVAGDTGNITTDGDIAVNGGDITTTSTGTATVFNTNATTLNIGGAATAVNIGSTGGSTTAVKVLDVLGGLITSSVGGLTLTTTGGNAIELLPSTTGDVQLTADTVRIGDQNANATITTYGTGDLILNTNAGSNSGSITIADGANGNITLAPNGTGDVQLDADTVRVGDANANATITTNGTGDLILNTNAGTNSGTITIADGANANITIEPNGTGTVILSTSNVQVGDSNVDAIIITNGTGNLNIRTGSYPSSANINLEDGANGNLTLLTHGTGDIRLEADTVRVGDQNTNATITTYGSGDLILNTDAGTNSGSITIVDGANGNINLTTNGTGDIQLQTDAVTVGTGSGTGTISSRGAFDLKLQTNDGTNSGTITITDGANGAINLTTDGTGDIQLQADTVRVGDNNANATITTYGTGDLILNTNDGTNSGSITIVDGANGNITLAPNGTGDIELQADAVTVGTGSGTGTISSSGAYDLLLQTNAGTNSGTITITNGANSNITVAPNGAGNVQLEADTVRVGDQNNTATITTYGTGDLLLNTNAGSSSGSITIKEGPNGNINLTTNQTGDIQLQADTVRVGDINANATITTYGTGDLILNTNAGSSSGSITIADGANGNINLTTDGTGDIQLQADTVQVGDANATATITTNGTGDLILNTNAGTNSGTITITQGTNGNITLAPNGTGDIQLQADTVQVGDANATATITTNGTGDLVLNTNAGTNAGSITLANGTNGNITLAPNGSGDIVLTLANGGNLTNSRNYVFGAIRNSTTESNGDIWVLDADAGGAGTLPVRGVSLDNSGLETSKNAAVVVRNYSTTAGFSPRIVFERSRGTAAAPATLNSGDTIGTIASTGYTSTIGWINDTIPAVPAAITMNTTEAWVSNTNLGTNFVVNLAPTATTITSAANLIQCINTNPQSSTYRSDAFTFRQGKSGTTDLLTLGTTSSTLKAKTIYLQDTSNTINSVIVTAGDPAGAGFNDRVAQIRQFSAITTTGEASTMTFQSARYNTGTSQYSPTLNGDEIGTFFFNGNYNTGATTAINGPTARFGAIATETWTSTANGSRFYVSTINTGTTTSTERMTLSNTNATLSSDAIALETSSGTDMMTMTTANMALSSDSILLQDSSGNDYLLINSNEALFSKPVRTTITTATVAQGGTYTPAATVMNSIVLTITSGSGTTYIDVDNLTVAGENGVYDVLVYNNTGSQLNANAIEIINGVGNVVLQHNAAIANGARALFEINCVDIYAGASFMATAV